MNWSIMASIFNMSLQVDYRTWSLVFAVLVFSLVITTLIGLASFACALLFTEITHNIY